MEVKEYILGNHFLGALIYGDYSGLDDAEEIMLNDFLNNVENHYFYKAKMSKVWDVKNFNSDLCRCEISGLVSDCFVFTLTYI